MLKSECVNICLSACHTCTFQSFIMNHFCLNEALKREGVKHNLVKIKYMFVVRSNDLIYSDTSL